MTTQTITGRDLAKPVEETRQSAHLENWYQAGDIFYGVVSGHPKLPDGAGIRTSQVVAFDPDAKTVTTLNTDYTLGEPYTGQPL